MKMYNFSNYSADVSASRDVEASDIPLLSKEGWLRDQEKAAKPPYIAQTGWSLKTDVSERVSETFDRKRPPRPLHQRWLRDIFLKSRPPLLRKEGNLACLKIC